MEGFLIRTLRRPTSAPRTTTATINGRSITVQPGETLLAAALREGVDFPHSCRVGACASCKCRITSGTVRELTETGYILRRDEIERGTVLACQSVPRSHVTVEIDRPTEGAAGTIVRTTKLTHDITRVVVQLDTPLPYRAGQHTLLSLDGLPGVSRSYSFAAPPRSDGRVEFFVRHVPGGLMSTVIHEQPLTGRRVSLQGAAGDFWLRDDDTPLVLVAGGSGLAPILALLEAAADRGVRRPVTLLFGARRKRDLYALDRIAALVDRWPARFRYVPVLSEASDDSDWDGETGLVTDLLAEHTPAGAHGYLCGPPGMVDAGVARLEALGIDAAHIHVDRFIGAEHGAADESVPGFAGPVTSAPLDPELADPAPRRPAHAADYLKYFGFHLVGLFAALGLLIGGHGITLALLGIVATYVLGDAFAGDDVETPHYRRPWILTVQLWLALPLIAVIMFVSVWSVCADDVLGFGAWITALTGHDVLAARAATTFGQHVAGWVLSGLMIGMVATIPAHELTHRTWDRTSMLVGRGLLAFSFDTIFSIEHVYGHHRYVSTTEDPATAPRGRNVYWHIVVSTIRGNVSAWRIEVERLRRRGYAVLSPHNAVIRGHLFSVGLVVVAWAMGGVTAAAYLLACMLWGKALLEIVNYMEHYGLVRSPSEPVQPRHSWNTNRRLSSWTLFNLSRHSHHHAQGEVPYQDLRPMPSAPQMISGYLSTLVLTLIPPVWHRLMTPRLVDWDRRYANAEERRLARRANAASGIARLVQRVG